ncbi:MAG: hypothetical protein AAF738_09505, partial [Bacteroidota bacterium]
MKKIMPHFIIVLLLVTVSTHLTAQIFSDLTKVVASNRASGDQFGLSTAISNDYAIVGAYHHNQVIGFNNVRANAGAAYIYKRTAGGPDNWGEIVTLRAADFDRNDRFGISVAIAGEYAVVGAYHEDHDANGNNTLTDAGAVYVFKRNQGGTDNWGQIKKIVASDRGANDNFGVSIAI